MAENSKLEYDLFISYTHLDNKPLSKEEEGWISRFDYSLNVRLGQLLGREPKIWRDEKLQGNDEFSEEIKLKLHNTKALLAVLSPRYLESEFCMDELRWFLKAAETGNGVCIGNKSRIFKMVKTYVPPEQHPDEIRGSKGYQFCELDEKKRPQEYNPEKGSGYEKKFWRKLEEIAWDICKLIKEFDQPNESGTEYGVDLPGKTVYLAETTSDLNEERENIRGELILQGYTIVPDRPLPYLLKDGKFKNCVREYLKRCKLSIHLIGNRYGLVPEGEEQSILELQNELAAELCQNGQLTRLIRIPPALAEREGEDRQREYITALQNDAPQVPGTELLKTKLEGFKTIILDSLKKINEPPVEKKSPEGPARVYLVCDQQDMETVKRLDDYLYNKGFEVMLPLFRGNEAERREMHKQYLSLCDAMIIYYDHANEFWMNTKLNDLRKAPGYGRTKPIKASAIFVAGEKTEHKERFRTREATIIKNYGPFSCDVLSPFVSRLHEGKGGC